MGGGLKRGTASLLFLCKIWYTYPMISKEEVLKIAKLARLQLSEPEVQKMQKDLSAILDYFDVLKKAPRIRAESYTEKHGKKNELRQDLVIEKPASLASKLVQAAPDKKDSYIKVKSIL